jgi:hypothetical protein
MRYEDMDIDKRIERLEKEVGELKERNHLQDMTELRKYNELEKLIAKAVEEGIEKVMQKFETLDKRITMLETAEAQKALKSNQEIMKTIKTIIVTFLVTLLLNNFMAIVSNNIKSTTNSNVANAKEVRK